MTTKSFHTHLMAFATGLGLITASSTLSAQGLFAPSEDRTPLLTAPPLSKEMKQCVYTLDTLADQMVFRYGWELRSNPPSPHSAALHTHMKKHAGLTNDLVKASRGKSVEAFEKAAREARASVIILLTLEKKATVGKTVSSLIERSGPIAVYIHANSDSFEVKPLIRLGKNSGKRRLEFELAITGDLAAGGEK